MLRDEAADESRVRRAGRGSGRSSRPAGPTLAFVIALLAAPPLAAQEGGQAVERLRLRSQSLIGGDTVALADVVSFAEAPGLRALETQPIAEGSAAGAPHEAAALRVTHEQVIGRLRELGVNLARVELAGAAACEVSFIPPPAPPEGEARGRDDAAPLFAPPRPAPRDGVGTLAEQVRAYLQRETSSLGGVVEVDFERAGQDVLALSTPPFEFTIRSADREKLGLREFSITIRREGQKQRTVTVAARVRLHKAVVVAARPLNRGARIRIEDLRSEVRLFERSGDVGVDSIDAAAGQEAAAFVPLGQMLRAADVKAVDLVTRSQRVHVVSGGSGVRLALTGVALDSGRRGDRVRVRLGDTREQRRVVEAQVTDFGTVSVAGM